MKKYMDKLKRNIHINKNLFIFLLVIVIVGIAAGSIFTIILNSDDKTLVLEYLNDFFNNAKEGKLAYSNSLVNALIFTIGFALLIWILGIAVIGFFIVLFLLFLKAFILGFSVSSIILDFKFKGVLLGLIYAFPHQVVSIFVFMLLSAYALIFSFKLIKALKSKTSLSFRNIMNRYLIILGISIIILTITSFYEIYAMPKLIQLVMSIIK